MIFFLDKYYSNHAITLTPNLLPQPNSTIYIIHLQLLSILYQITAHTRRRDKNICHPPFIFHFEIFFDLQSQPELANG